ncbi:Rieske 2Fe-2S domain-containing protein [Bacillus toyonensis]|uniref:Rieske 2Fe-2S domain-containing protein n=1 Tax=Bacillus toyonensis TaxID=155322 RepID=UPI000BFA62F4|nr:Rieske 2Fe-2S domain-containing protein [Bacillus toyonensis]PGC89435.1 hypothetical protein COM39_14515 [Bacillus toyonensis]
MAVKIFENNIQNFHISFPDENKGVYCEILGDKPKIINNQCKHRGGPIHLCKMDQDNKRRCIWHNMVINKLETCNFVGVVYIKSMKKITVVADYNGNNWPVSFTNSHIDI